MNSTEFSTDKLIQVAQRINKTAETVQILDDIVGEEQMNMLTLPIPIEFGALVLSDMIRCNGSARMTAIAYWSFLMNMNMEVSKLTQKSQVQ